MNGTKLLAIVLGLWVLLRSVNKDASGRTLIDHIIGNQASKSPLLQLQLSNNSGPANSAGEVNPFPGASGAGGRLDQGIDVTGKNFLSPVSGKVVLSRQSDPGWKGGGYVAIQDAADPNRVYYFAEGIAPIVSTGQTVQAGERIAIPKLNPYNGTLGNIEFGRANPASPGQPLAQVISNPAGMVQQLYSWLRSLGGPSVSSTSAAGHT